MFFLAEIDQGSNSFFLLLEIPIREICAVHKQEEQHISSLHMFCGTEQTFEEITVHRVRHYCGIVPSMLGLMWNINKVK